jgi:hypothetical protein
MTNVTMHVTSDDAVPKIFIPSSLTHSLFISLKQNTINHKQLALSRHGILASDNGLTQ